MAEPDRRSSLVPAGRASLAPAADAIALAAKETIEHKSAAALGALVFDLVSRQGDSRTLFTGKELVERRAEEHGVGEKDAQTSVGNLLGVLERGPESEAERHLVSVMALRGLRDRLRKLEGAEREQAVDRFVRHADFFELSSPISLYAAMEPTLGDDEKALVVKELAQVIVDEGSGERGRTGAARAKNAARLSALGRSSHPAARTALATIEGTQGLDRGTRALARELLGAVGGGAVVRGRLERPRSAPWARALAFVTGFALLVGLFRGLLALIGARREVTLSLESAGLRIDERTVAFGRVLRETSSSLTLTGIRSFAKETRWPRAHLYVGAIALGVGVLVGGTWIFDGARGGDLGLLAIGAAVLVSGALLDLVLDVIVPMREGTTSIEIATDRARRIRIGAAPAADAERMIELLRQRVR